MPSGYRASAERAREADKARVKVSLLGQTRGFYLPTRQPRVNPLPPDRRLKLDWVYPSQCVVKWPGCLALVYSGENTDI